jgi:arylsulfatase A-like enzyme
VHGVSLLPLVRRKAREVRDELFAELTYHAAYDPMRAIRTRRHKLIRHFGERLLPVLPNVDDSPSKDLLVAAGWAEQPRPRLELYDLLADPIEMRNLAYDDVFAEILDSLSAELDVWMEDTADPLLAGPVPVPLGGVVNDPAGLSPREPYVGAVD